MDIFDSSWLHEASTSAKDINGNGEEKSSHICRKMHDFQIQKDHYLQHNHFSSWNVGYITTITSEFSALGTHNSIFPFKKLLRSLLISQQTQYFISNCILFSLDLFMFTSSRFEIQPCRIISNKHTKVTGNNFIVFMADNIRYFAKLCHIM